MKGIVLVEVNNPNKGIIVSDNGHFKVQIENNKYFLNTQCKGCGATQILKNGQCAYCKGNRV